MAQESQKVDVTVQCLNVHYYSEEPIGAFLTTKHALAVMMQMMNRCKAQEFANSKSIMKESQLSLLISQIAMTTTLY